MDYAAGWETFQFFVHKKLDPSTFIDWKADNRLISGDMSAMKDLQV